MPIAFWCVFVAGLLPYVAFNFVKGRENEAPRESEAKLTGRNALALGAHSNAFEVFPFFAFAVVSEQIFRGPNLWVDGLAVLFVAARLGHMGFYLAGRGSLRSLCFTIGFIDTIAIFLIGAL
jgi:uncharacterized MAPEG superfamily protein